MSGLNYLPRSLMFIDDIGYAFPSRSDPLEKGVELFKLVAEAAINQFRLEEAAYYRRCSAEKKRAKGPIAERPISKFKMVAYTVLSNFSDRYGHSFFAFVMASYGESDDAQMTLYETWARARPFDLGLRAMNLGRDGLSSKERDKISTLLYGAYCHHIPPEFVVAFLAYYESPLLTAIKNRTIIPEFEGWVLGAHASLAQSNDLAAEARAYQGEWNFQHGDTDLWWMAFLERVARYEYAMLKGDKKAKKWLKRQRKQIEFLAGIFSNPEENAEILEGWQKGAQAMLGHGVK